MVARGVEKEQGSIYFFVMSKPTNNKFNHYKELYRDNKFDVLLKDKKSAYWLKLRSISRKELMVEFCELANIKHKDLKANELFEHIYNNKPDAVILNQFIENKYQIERAERKGNETKLISELYKLEVFDWGGLHQSNLERSIVDNYVKKIKNFGTLTKKVDSEIHEKMKHYVLSSWFNHWTSILIEDIFKDHKKVTPTVGLIKKIDFFINDIPFDLKVTYFPSGFMQVKRKELGLCTEVQELKNFARTKGIEYNKAQTEKIIFIELLRRFKESTNPEIKKFIDEFNNTRRKIIKSTMNKPKELIRWLYEEQGERRFDAANRMFVVLIDEDTLEESWKMKRNLDLLRTKIIDHLDGLDFTDIKKFDVTFRWKDEQKYSVLSDILFITKT